MSINQNNNNTTPKLSFKRECCDCDWGIRCKTLGRLYAKLNLKLGSKVRIKDEPTTKALRKALVHYLHVDQKHKGDIHADYHVALHHWSPALVERNYYPPKGQKKRSFNVLLDATEAATCGLDSNTNTYQQWMERSGVPREDWHPSKGGVFSYLQAPTMPMSAVKHNLLARAERKDSAEAAVNDLALIIAPPHPLAPPPLEVPPAPPRQAPALPALAALNFAAIAATLQTPHLLTDSSATMPICRPLSQELVLPVAHLHDYVRRRYLAYNQAEHEAQARITGIANQMGVVPHPKIDTAQDANNTEKDPPYQAAAHRREDL